MSEYSVESLQQLILNQHRSTSTEAIAALRAFYDLLEQREADESSVPVCWRYYNSLGEIVSEWIDGGPPERHYGYPLGNDITDEITVECAFTHPPAQTVPDIDRAKIEAVINAPVFHEAYERLAPSFGYATREETRSFDPDSNNGKLMIAVCAEIEHKLQSALGETK